MDHIWHGHMPTHDCVLGKCSHVVYVYNAPHVATCIDTDQLIFAVDGALFGVLSAIPYILCWSDYW